MLSMTSPWKKLLVIILGLITFGWTAHAYLGDVARVQDVHAVETRVEKNTKDIEQIKTMHRSIEIQLERGHARDLMQGQQLFEIATKVGARTVPGIRADAADAGVSP